MVPLFLFGWTVASIPRRRPFLFLPPCPFLLSLPTTGPSRWPGSTKKGTSPIPPEKETLLLAHAVRAPARLGVDVAWHRYVAAEPHIVSGGVVDTRAVALRGVAPAPAAAARRDLFAMAPAGAHDDQKGRGRGADDAAGDPRDGLAVARPKGVAASGLAAGARTRRVGRPRSRDRVASVARARPAPFASAPPVAGLVADDRLARAVGRVQRRQARSDRLRWLRCDGGRCRRCCGTTAAIEPGCGWHNRGLRRSRAPPQDRRSAR